MLDLTLSFDRDTFQPDEPIRGQFVLRNTGAEPALVNARLALNTPYSPDEFRELDVAVTDPAGQALEFQTRVNLGEPADSDFRLLQPGETLQSTYTLSKYYSLQQPGAYRVQATYHNQSEPSRLNGHAPWKGEVKSNPATFTLAG